MKKKFLEVGRIVGTHGIRGELRVEPWCDSPDFLAQFKTLYYNSGDEKIKVSSRPHKNIVLMKIKGIESIEEAEVLRGRVLYIDRNSVKLPEGKNFVQDLLGCRVLNADDKTVEYGTIADVFKTGANDVYTVKSTSGKEYLIPVIDSVVVEKNVDDGIVLVRPMEGLFDDEA
ncbi:MAG: 16S rRNA processing protein RimM [Ruminococcus sp.]|nr:16S rRNA processing protein RimM [Ruminococcus sp.]